MNHKMSKRRYEKIRDAIQKIAQEAQILQFLTDKELNKSSDIILDQLEIIDYQIKVLEPWTNTLEDLIGDKSNEIRQKDKIQNRRNDHNEFNDKR